MAEELLDGADVVAAFEEVGGERMAEGVQLERLSMPVARKARVTARWTLVSW